MAVVTMRQMLEAGVHFGHQTRRWNPKMKRYIWGERSGIYILDLEQTLPLVDKAYGFVRDLVADGGTVLFIGTKKQAQDAIQSEAMRAGMPYVNQRWLGGMLTNFETISKRVAKLQEYERRRDSGEFAAMPKKEALILSRELEKLERNLGGIRRMTRPPEAVFVIDTKKEHIAVTEANKLGIPVVAVVDTNCDPDLVQYVIPGNDDAIRASQLLARVIADAIVEGRYVGAKRGGVAAEAAVRTPEEEASFRAGQEAARRQAAAAQAERDQRLAVAVERARTATTTATSPVVEAAAGGGEQGGSTDAGQASERPVPESPATGGVATAAAVTTEGEQGTAGGTTPADDASTAGAAATPDDVSMADDVPAGDVSKGDDASSATAISATENSPTES